MEKINWKFWTWPRQIRELTAKLATAQQIIERQRKELEQRHADIAARPHRHRAQHL